MGGTEYLFYYYDDISELLLVDSKTGGLLEWYQIMDCENYIWN